MEKEKDVIEFDFDPDVLSGFLQQLSLEPSDKELPDISGSLNILETEPNAIETNVIKETPIASVLIKQELKDESDDENSPHKESEVHICNKEPLYIKEEDTSDLNSVKSESSSESDEEEFDLLERGGKERSKKRSNKHKLYDRHERNVNAADLNPQLLRHLSAGCIVQNNSIDNQLAIVNNTAPTNHFTSSTNYAPPNSPENGFNWFIDNQESGYIPSPESGYDTSDVRTPSPPNYKTLGIFETNSYEARIDKEKEQPILDSSRELEKSTTELENYKFPILNDTSPGIDQSDQSLLDDILECIATLESRVEIKSFPDLNDNNFERIEELKMILKNSEETETLQLDEFFNSSVNETSNYPDSNCGTHDCLSVGGGSITRNKNFLNFNNNKDQLQLDEFFNSSGSETSNFQDNNNVTHSLHNNVQSSSNIPVNQKMPLKLCKKSFKKTKEKHITYELKDQAKRRLRNSKHFDNKKYSKELMNLFSFAKKKEQEVKEKIKIIDYEEGSSDNLKRTNLHNAVLNLNIEKVLCLVEGHKMYTRSITFDINIRDVNGKTVLDYAIEKGLPELIDYLKENMAIRGI